MADITLEGLFDKISEAIIDNLQTFAPTELPEGWKVDDIIRDSQKVVRGGKLQVGRQPGEKLVLFDQDVIANSEDLLQNKFANFSGCDDGTVEVVVESTGEIKVNHCNTLYDEGETDITEEVYNIGNENPLNVGQFIDFDETKTNINSELAQEFLDTNIFELLQAGDTRQQRINKFFAEYAELKGDAPLFDEDGDGQVDEDFDSSDYSTDHDISYAQECEGDDCPDEEDRSITRLNQDSNAQNQSKTLQWLRDDLSNFLVDVDEEIELEIEDGRPDYKNKSDGFLKIRNLNQGIVVRKQEGDNIGIENNISITANTTGIAGNLHPHVLVNAGGEGPTYLMNGLTITMWVRFLDRTSRGTLFNFGNPLRGNDPKGFRLETYVLGKNEELESQSGVTWGNSVGTNDQLFANNNNYERFIRLVVYDHIPTAADIERRLYDSHIGLPGLPRSDNSVPEFGESSGGDYQKGNEVGLLNHTRVPIDFNEWYFIVATYNPLIHDGDSTHNATYAEVPEYWLGQVDPTNGSYTNNSGYGSKCKVEVISRSDLLRARGFQG